MAHITLSIPDKIYEEIKEIKEINWSEVARKAIILKYLLLKSERSGLTKEELDILEDLLSIEKERSVEFGFKEELKILRELREKSKRRVME